MPLAVLVNDGFSWSLILIEILYTNVMAILGVFF